MADLKTEQGITAEIQKQRDLLKDIDGRTKAGIRLKEKIVTLEEKLEEVQSRISAEEVSITKEIEKTNFVFLSFFCFEKAFLNLSKKPSFNILSLSIYDIIQFYLLYVISQCYGITS